MLANFQECQQGPLHQHGCKGAAITIFLTAVSVAGGKDAAITNFLTAVSVAGCKGTATTFFLTAVSRAGCKDATTTNLLDFDIFPVHFWLPGLPECPWGPLGVTSAPGPLKKSILDAFGDPFGASLGTRLGSFSCAGLPWGPDGQLLEAMY